MATNTQLDEGKYHTIKHPTTGKDIKVWIPDESDDAEPHRRAFASRENPGDDNYEKDRDAFMSRRDRMKEETINEISKKTMLAWRDKAIPSADKSAAAALDMADASKNHMWDAEDAEQLAAANNGQTSKTREMNIRHGKESRAAQQSTAQIALGHADKAANRRKGIDYATRKLTAENTEANLSIVDGIILGDASVIETAFGQAIAPHIVSHMNDKRLEVAANIFKESVEPLDEISDDARRAYIHGAAKSLTAKAAIHKGAEAAASKHHAATQVARRGAVAAAQIGDKEAFDKHLEDDDAHYKSETSNRKIARQYGKEIARRKEGISRAMGKLTREDVELEEAFTDLPQHQRGNWKHYADRKTKDEADRIAESLRGKVTKTRVEKVGEAYGIFIIPSSMKEEVELNESTQRHCSIYKAKDKNWYMDLADHEYGEHHESTTYGPFASEEHVHRELKQHSNPGGYNDDDSGEADVPKKSPNGRPIHPGLSKDGGFGSGYGGRGYGRRY